MNDFARDPLNNAIQNGIKDDIAFNVEHRRYRAALILMLSGIDAMAYLDMPIGQTEVKATDYISWVNTYIKFPCKEQITGEEIYSARCAMLHTYGADSKMTRSQKCRMIAWMDVAVPEIRFAPAISTTLVMVSIKGLMDSFFTGVDRFLVRAFSDQSRNSILEERLDRLVIVAPHDPDVK